MMARYKDVNYDQTKLLNELIEPLFLQLLMRCDNANLIGEDMFAIDGCKLSSNASKDWSRRTPYAHPS